MEGQNGCIKCEEGEIYKMAFIKELKKAISDAGQETVTKAKNFAGVAQLNDAINALNQQITQLYANIGKEYYECHKDDNIFEEYTEWMSALRDTHDKIAQYRQQISQLKGNEICQSCGAGIPVGSLFCSSCGVKVIRTVPDQQEGRFCPKRHASVGEGDSFCMACGANLCATTNSEKL